MPCRLRLLPGLILLALACGRPATDTSLAPRSGPWRMELDLRDSGASRAEILPFLFDLEHDSAGWVMRVHNGMETIVVNEISLANDSIRMRMPLFDSEFLGAVLNDSTLSGSWYNYNKGPAYRIPFTAHAGKAPRFAGHERSTIDLGGPWETHFSPGTTGMTNAIGSFHPTPDRVTGTFATECGDYRFLEGISTHDSLLLSCFDGSHAFLFKAVQRNDSLIGRFWSGVHWQEPWVAVKNPDFHLRDEDSLTYLKEGYDMVDFRFPGIDGGLVSPKDSSHAGRVLLVQVLGSWCPNCVDEALLLKTMYTKYHAQGLDVIGVAFERQPDRAKALAGLKRFRDHLSIPYPLSYAGDANKETASAQLPFLDRIVGYPTCIFIGRDGKVKRIHTGFYGPGTGEPYAAYERELDRYLNDLLGERTLANAAH